MADKHDPGGPAFPLERAAYPGMTWLDYAAIQIAAGMYSTRFVMSDAMAAEEAYGAAAVLLAEKRRREQEGKKTT